MIAIDKRDNISILNPNAWICSKYILQNSGCTNNLLPMLVEDSFALAAQWQVDCISMLHLNTVGCWWLFGMWFTWPERCILGLLCRFIFERQEMSHGHLVRGKRLLTPSFHAGKAGYHRITQTWDHSHFVALCVYRLKAQAVSRPAVTISMLMQSSLRGM